MFISARVDFIPFPFDIFSFPDIEIITSIHHHALVLFISHIFLDLEIWLDVSLDFHVKDYSHEFYLSLSQGIPTWFFREYFVIYTLHITVLEYLYHVLCIIISIAHKLKFVSRENQVKFVQGIWCFHSTFDTFS